MKHTKAFSVILLIVALVTLTFTACGGETSEVGAKVVETSEDSVVIEATATGGSLEDALKALAEAGELTYDGSESEYGFYISSINGREAGEYQYWAIYTTLGEYDGVGYSNADFGTLDRRGTIYNSAAYGVSGMIMVKGEKYLIFLDSWYSEP